MYLSINLTTLLSCLVAILLPIGKNISSALSEELKSNQVPPAFSVSDYAKALERDSTFQNRPNQLDISGNLRRADLSSSLGRVELRWPRETESYFSKSADRLVLDAMKAASRVLSRSAFPSRLKQSSYDWRIVFMQQVPMQIDVALRTGLCHPAWMTPPADLFIAAERVATGCGAQALSRSEATAQLMQTLVHELGHAIEFQLSDKGFPFVSRWHSEGFASWFETLASEAIVGESKVVSRPEMRKRAQSALFKEWRPRMFVGSSDDYARSYALIAAVAEGHSLSRLVDVYKRMSDDGIRFEQAIERELGWDDTKWVAEAIKHLKK